jgi:hypothetical protein
MRVAPSRVAPLFVALLAAAFPANAAAADCQRHVNDVKDFGPGLAEPVVLSPEKGSEQRLKNFGGNRGIKEFRDIRLVSDKRLPDTLTSARLGFEALIERADDKLESVDFPDPTFTEPRITGDRKHIVFTICLNAKGVSPGKYVGSVTVGGPDGLGEARVGITANLKARWVVWAPLAILAMILSWAALFFKDWTKDRSSITGGWWFKTIGILVVTFGVIAGVYINDPTWGASVFGAGIALIGTALASVGGRKLIE